VFKSVICWSFAIEGVYFHGPGVAVIWHVRVKTELDRKCLVRDV